MVFVPATLTGDASSDFHWWQLATVLRTIAQRHAAELAGQDHGGTDRGHKQTKPQARSSQRCR